jgi:glycosyltransferase involved in cell wall biosynthesis
MTDSVPDRPARVLRVIARMNVGGPAFHVSILSAGLDPDAYETRLLTGGLGAGEGSLEALADSAGVDRRHVPGLGPAVRPLDDLRALLHLTREIRRWRPDIVHTHTAKAGTLGRLATWAARGPRPVVVHTYHGHVLTGYFGPAANAVYRTIERVLARGSTRLIGVSQATVDELVALRVAPRERFSVVPIGLDLSAFLDVGPPDAEDRAALGAGREDIVVTYVGRLVPIKRVDVLVDAVARARILAPRLHLVIVGDGELRGDLQMRASAAGLDGHISFLGFRDDLPRIAAGTDIAALSSDNEGTPVALIEAAAAGRPSVATAVGGVTDIVRAGTGRTTPAGDVDALAAALADLAADPAARADMGAAARAHVRDRYSQERLLRDIEELYGELLRGRRGARGPISRRASRARPSGR